MRKTNVISHREASSPDAPSSARKPAQLEAPSQERPRVLLVDDEPRILEGLTAHLRRRYEVDAVSEAREAVRRLEHGEHYQVLVTDMRMPVMNGVDVLREALRLSPDTVRILLTGYADIMTAAQAINEGRIFRFLTKPCPPPLVNRALHDAVVHYRQQTNDRGLVASEVQRICQQLIETDRLASLGVLAGGLGSQLIQLSTVLLSTFSSLEQTLGGKSLPLDEQLQDIRWVGRKLRDHSRTLSRMVTESAAGPRRFDLADLVRQTVDDLEVFGPLKTARLTIDIGHSGVWVEGEQTRLRHALVNVLLASVRAVEQDSCQDSQIGVAVRTDADHHHAIIRIRDNGQHASNGEVSRLEEWLMSDDSTRKGQLSLSTVQLIVEEHAGELRMNDAADGGTCFEIVLPLVDIGMTPDTLVEIDAHLGMESTWGDTDE